MSRRTARALRERKEKIRTQLISLDLTIMLLNQEGADLMTILCDTKDEEGQHHGLISNLDLVFLSAHNALKLKSARTLRATLAKDLDHLPAD